MKYVGGILLLFAGGLAQPVVMNWIHHGNMDSTLMTSLSGNVITIMVIGFLLIGFDRKKESD